MIGAGLKKSRPWACVLPALVVTALLWAPPVADAASEAAPGGCFEVPGRTLVVATVPKVVGFTFEIDGQHYTTDASGRVQIASLSCEDPEHALVAPSRNFAQRRGTTAAFDSWHAELRLGSAGGDGTIYAAFRQRTLVHLRLVDLAGMQIPRSQVGRIVIKGSTGALIHVRRDRSSVVLDSSRVVGPSAGLVSKDVLWSVQRVGIDGNSAITRGKVRFEPRRTRRVTVPLMFYPLHVTVHDAILGRPVGDVVSVVAPDGTVRTVRLGPGGAGEVPAISRGRYILRAGGGSIAISFRQPVAVSRSEDAELTVVSYVDVAIVGAALLALVLGLFLIGRLLQRRRASASHDRSGHGPAHAGVARPSLAGAAQETSGPTAPPRTEEDRP